MPVGLRDRSPRLQGCLCWFPRSPWSGWGCSSFPALGSELPVTMGQAVTRGVARESPRTAGTEPLPLCDFGLPAKMPCFPPGWLFPRPPSASRAPGTPQRAQAFGLPEQGPQRGVCSLEEGAGSWDQNSPFFRLIGRLPPQRDLCLNERLHVDTVQGRHGGVAEGECSPCLS